MGGQADTCYIITKVLSLKYLAKRMDGFPSSSPALQRGKGGGDINKEQLMEEVKAQIAVQNVQTLLRQMSNKCFQQVHHVTRLLPRELREQMRRHVHGSLHGRLEYRQQSVRVQTTKGVVRGRDAALRDIGARWHSLLSPSGPRCAKTCVM